MAELLSEKVLAQIGKAEEVDHRLVLIAAPSGSGKFAQGTVSARLFRTVPDYRSTVSEWFHGQSAKDFNKEAASRVVYAVGASKVGPLAESLFFFSFVNPVQHREMLDAMGWPAALCRIARQRNEAA
jgi:uncharacterized protein (TIGR04141 family)